MLVGGIEDHNRSMHCGTCWSGSDGGGMKTTIEVCIVAPVGVVMERKLLKTYIFGYAYNFIIFIFIFD